MLPTNMNKKILDTVSVTPQPPISHIYGISEFYVTLFSSYHTHKVFGKLILTLRSRSLRFERVQEF